MPSNQAPVEDVGGPQSEGPWPSDVEAVAEGDQPKRPVRLNDDSTQEVTVTVTAVNQLTRDDGEETDGYAVAYQYDDPTLDGGA
jgi:hypothetical protein